MMTDQKNKLKRRKERTTRKVRIKTKRRARKRVQKIELVKI
jgi:hypothetical protein